MKYPYLLAAHMPEPLAHYGLYAPAPSAVPPRPGDFDQSYADSQIAGLGLLTALILRDTRHYETHVANLGLDVRAQIIALADVAPFVCRHQTIVEFTDGARESVRQAAYLLLCADAAARTHWDPAARPGRQLEAARAVRSILDAEPLPALLSAVQEVVVATYSPDHLEWFGDSMSEADTPLTW